MATFLTREDLYRMLQRELPPADVYPDGAPSGSFSTAENDSVALVASSAYFNLSRIEANNFILTANERMDDWVAKYFAKSFDPATPLETKRQRVIDKIRKQPTITLWEILKIVVSYLPEGIYGEVKESCGAESFWQLGVSMLGIDTILKGLLVFDLNPAVEVSDWCAFISDPNRIGWRLSECKLGVDTFLSQYKYTDIAQIQFNAYGYEIRIFGYTMPPDDLENMLSDVIEAEPARSGRLVRQNLNLSDFGLTTIVNNADQFSGVDCITRDPSSTTGYTGLKV
jgi:hypothetical protein